jgi:hypothetical protein
VLDDFWPAVAELFPLGRLAHTMKNAITFTLCLTHTLILGCVVPQKPQPIGATASTEQVTVSADRLTRELVRRALRGELSLVVTSPKGGRTMFHTTTDQVLTNPESSPQELDEYIRLLQSMVRLTEPWTSSTPRHLDYVTHQ